MESETAWSPIFCGGVHNKARRESQIADRIFLRVFACHATVKNDLFDAIMVGYQIANRSAELQVLPQALAQEVGETNVARNLFLIHKWIGKIHRRHKGFLDRTC
jgi:hypothetical protein